MSSGKKTTSPNQLLILAACSVFFCWLYGLGGLIFAWMALKRLFGKGRKSPKGKTGRKILYAKVMAITGAILSLLNLTYYIIAFSSGAYVRFF